MQRACTSVMYTCPRACTACTQQVRQVRLPVLHTQLVYAASTATASPGVSGL